VILLADGVTPVLVDQPEDALHAPWIEEYLVDRLRDLRGSRQYLFATRSPGIVVSGDAEQIVTMKATAGHGEVEASGSLERYELNRLALDHLEGGPVPFSRRAMKVSHPSKARDDCYSDFGEAGLRSSREGPGTRRCPSGWRSRPAIAASQKRISPTATTFALVKSCRAQFFGALT
jgi:hypothetical protein